jgi:hypothetical protein
MAKFKRLRFASQIVVVSITAISIYILIDIAALLITGTEPTITPYVFGFFGGELTLLAAKRILVKEGTTATTSTKTGVEGDEVVTTKLESEG